MPVIIHSHTIEMMHHPHIDWLVEKKRYRVHSINYYYVKHKHSHDSLSLFCILCVLSESFEQNNRDLDTFALAIQMI